MVEKYKVNTVLPSFLIILALARKVHHYIDIPFQIGQACRGKHSLSKLGEFSILTYYLITRFMYHSLESCLVQCTFYVKVIFYEIYFPFQIFCFRFKVVKKKKKIKVVNASFL